MTKTIGVGETFKITATTVPAGLPVELEWTNSAEEFATLSATGKTGTVEAVAEGETTITAQVQDKPELTATTIVTITTP